MADDRRGWWKSMINRENNQAEQKKKNAPTNQKSEYSETNKYNPKPDNNK